ncbi:retrovirus-related pol polyprotein from transposon TNT 1-94 [Tanacetum coccineum]|uniref:Retrovirus-related pol polyprotein from transposon TNT 1-94 n=1 Tax=Tanacetum coccineum TaxID=301880 RepID=A0ABQ5D9X5_9ASTR
MFKRRLIAADQASVFMAMMSDHNNSDLAPQRQEMSVENVSSGLKDWYPKDSGFGLTAFSDVDHAGCLDTRKSTSGGIQFLGDKLVSSMSKKQNCTAMSSAEAEGIPANWEDFNMSSTEDMYKVEAHGDPLIENRRKMGEFGKFDSTSWLVGHLGSTSHGLTFLFLDDVSLFLEVEALAFADAQNRVENQEYH